MKKVAKKKATPAKRKKIVHKIQSEYLGKVYGKQFLKLVPLAVKKLRAIKKKYPFDAIAFRGSSGAALAFPLSYFLKLPLIHVRKGESHYSGTIEGTISSKRYIIVDDFIDRGTTVKKIISEIKKNIGAKPVAICLYSAGTYRNNAMYNDIPLFSV